MQIVLQVVDGVDKGRCFDNVQTPVTMGREEGNVIRLNDERVSRFHAKIQEDHGQVVLTDLDSTNGTSVNGEPIQLRLLRPGDRVGIGRSILVFGSVEEIEQAVNESNDGQGYADDEVDSEEVLDASGDPEVDDDSLQTNFIDGKAAQSWMKSLTSMDRDLPRLPGRMTPAQAAQLSEVIDYLHRSLADATDSIHIPPNARDARLPLAQWHQIQMVLGFLARYSREVAEPDDMAEHFS